MTKTKLCQMQDLIDQNWLILSEPVDAICYKRAVGYMKAKCMEHKNSTTEKFYLCKEHLEDLREEGTSDRDFVTTELKGYGTKQFVLVSKKGECNFRVTFRDRII